MFSVRLWGPLIPAAILPSCQAGNSAFDMVSRPQAAPARITADMISGGLVVAVLLAWVVNVLDLGFVLVARMNFSRMLDGLGSVPMSLPRYVWRIASHFERWWFVVLTALGLVLYAIWVSWSRPTSKRRWTWLLVGSFGLMAVCDQVYDVGTFFSYFAYSIANLIFAATTASLIAISGDVVVRTMSFLRERL